MDRSKWKRGLALFLITIMMVCGNGGVIASGEENEEKISTGEDVLIQAPAGILMEAGTGTMLYEKGDEEKRSPASITKIMTLLLIFDSMSEGNLKLTDTVTTSAYAKSMGGSQVFLEEGETQDVETMIKCIVIASGNDASVAMAEHIAGSEQEFVKRMNQRAEQLGMKNTHFEDCCGLTDSDNHYTTAKDVAIMSRELITRYPQILDYSSIWMENILHVTRQGSKEFTLTNTNKLLRSYEGCKGLKTGSTSKAKYCVSAVAEKNGITLIAVIMGAPDYKVRFKDGAALLNYGFSKCSLYIDEQPPKLSDIKVKKGEKDQVSLVYENTFTWLGTEGKSIGEVKRKLIVPEQVKAPVRKGEKAGEMEYYDGDRKLGSVQILYNETVPASSWMYCLKKLGKRLAFHMGQQLTSEQTG
nr:D-alanyl-D-alanine carboxypeptidase family protein [uncultured Blautia sp.]